MIYLAALAVQAVTQSGIAGQSPVFELCKNFIGGKWEGTVGKHVRVEFRFHLEDHGNKLVAQGVVGLGTKNPMNIRSSFGWDPDLKQVYYLDQHGYDTVYFGHVTREGDVLVTDFKGLSGDTGHYLSRDTVGKDTYESTMDEEKDGKWQPLGLHIVMHRVKGS